MESRWRGLPGSRRSSNEMGDKKIEEHVLEIERRKTRKIRIFVKSKDVAKVGGGKQEVKAAGRA